MFWNFKSMGFLFSQIKTLHKGDRHAVEIMALYLQKLEADLSRVFGGYISSYLVVYEEGI